jgi:hypothetical protein
MQAFHFAKKKPPKETKHVPEKESCQARNIPNPVICHQHPSLRSHSSSLTRTNSNNGHSILQEAESLTLLLFIN